MKLLNGAIYEERAASINFKKAAGGKEYLLNKDMGFLDEYLRRKGSS